MTWDPAEDANSYAYVAFIKSMYAIRLRAELIALIAVDDFLFAVCLEGFLYCSNDKVSLQRIADEPAYD